MTQQSVAVMVHKSEIYIIITMILIIIEILGHDMYIPDITILNFSIHIFSFAVSRHFSLLAVINDAMGQIHLTT